MPLKLVSVAVVRTIKTHLGGGDYSEADCPLAGSPFTGRVYRTLQKTTTDDEAGPGIAPLDEMQRLSIMDPACPIQVNDICLLPRPSGSVRRAKVVRVRPYGDRTQFDLETGAEGDGPLLLAALAADIAEQSSNEVVSTAAAVDIAEQSSNEVVSTAAAVDIAEQSSNEVVSTALAADIAEQSSNEVIG